MFMTSAPLIRATARAATIGSAGEFCVLSLQNNSKTGIQATGNASITNQPGQAAGIFPGFTLFESSATLGTATITTNVFPAAMPASMSAWIR